MSDTHKDLYEKLGVSAGKEEVHAAIKDEDKGLYPRAFCKILPDVWQGDEDYCSMMHADTAGTKTSLAYLYWRETGDYSVWEGIAQDALVMNLDDMACVGAVDRVLISSTIGRNKNLVDGRVIQTLIAAARSFVESMAQHGIELHLAGGETADVGDIVRTIDVGYTTGTRMRRDELLINDIQNGDVIVALSSGGQASYESSYNSGIGSNGLTGARHQILSSYHREKYPETCDPSLDHDIAYSGKHRITDSVTIQGDTYSIKSLLLSPTRTYLPYLKSLLAEHRADVHGIIHNTGGALTKVMKFAPGMRIIKDNLLDRPAVFELISEAGQMPAKEMYRVYNLGQRLEVYLPAEHAQSVIDIASNYGIHAQIIGRVEAADKSELIIRDRGEEHRYDA